MASAVASLSVRSALAKSVKCRNCEALGTSLSGVCADYMPLVMRVKPSARFRAMASEV